METLNDILDGFAAVAVPVIVFAACGLVLAGTVYGLTAAAQFGLDYRADKRKEPVPYTDDDRLWEGAVTAGDPLSRRSLREIARQLALQSWRVQEKAISNSRKRHARKQAKENASP